MCKKIKGINQFGKAKRYKDGIAAWCIRCFNNYAEKWRIANKDKVKKASIKWKKENPDRLRFYNEQQRKRKRLAALKAYCKGKIKCACCGEKEIKFLSIDHIKGGGNKHRIKLGKGGGIFYNYLKRNNYPKGYQVLCYNCNLAKGFYGKCPHKKRK